MYDAIGIERHPRWYEAVCQALYALNEMDEQGFHLADALPLAWSAGELTLVADRLGTRVDDEKAVGAWQAIRVEYIDLDDDLLGLIIAMADYAHRVIDGGPD